MNLRNRLPFFLAYAQKKSSKPIFLEYVETDGSSYIDTGYCPNENTYIEYTFEVTQNPTASYNGLFGSRVNTSIEEYHIFLTSGLTLRLDFGRYAEPNVNYKTELNTKYTIKAGLGEIYINDELVKSYTPKTGQTKNSMYLGNFNNNGTPYTTGVAQKIYGWKVYENNVLLQDLRPALDPNGKVCMYDTVTKQYFYNQGTGELKAGGRFVESILFDGESYVNTGIAHQTCTIEVTIKFEETGARQLMGFGTNTSQYWGKAANQSSLEYFGGTNILDKTDVRLDFNTDDPTAVTLIKMADGKTSAGSTGPAVSNVPYLIGCLKVNPTSTKTYYPFTGQVWGQKTYIGGELVQDLRPYVDGDGVACFKDVVTDTLFYNQGTGTLTYTEYEELEYLELDGTQYIDTGIVYQTCDVECRIKFHETGTRQLMGFSGASSVHYWGLSTSGVFEPLTSVSASGFTDVRIEYNKDNPDAKTITMIVGDKTATKTGKIDTDKSYLIGCLDGTDYWCTCEIKHNKIYIGGKLVQDLIPVKRSDGVVCMYDRVENKYYELKGV